MKKIRMKNRKNSLAIFFTRGVSIEKWYKQGIFKRETLIYEKLSPFFDTIYFFTYGTQNDLLFQYLLPENIKIVPKILNVNDMIYSFLLPFFNSLKLRKCTIFKSNQLDGSWSGLIAKYLSNGYFINRSGYIPSLFTSKMKSNILKTLFYILIEKILFTFSDWNIIGSISDYKYIKDQLKIKFSNISIIPNFVDIKLFRRIPTKKIKNSLVFVGRLTRQKNLFNLIKAISSINYKLYLIGDGELKESLKKFSRKQNSNVIFLGLIPNDKLPEILNRFEIFVLPSHIEGMPKALIEAMACGLPVICSDTNEFREIIKDNVNGILSKNDYLSLRHKIQFLMENPKLRKNIGIEALKAIKTKYNIDIILRKELEIYNKLINKKKK
ncbi:MAG: glycosyltransferase family 4 protein [Promethearchaeota archaeon]